VSGIPDKSQQDLCLLFKDEGPICLFGTGYTGLTRVFFGEYGLYIAIMILNAFILTTLDTATRVCRYITEELTGASNRLVSTLIVVAVAGVLAFSGAWSRIWPIFGASNQLVAALALFVASLWLLMKKRPTAYTFVPAIFMFLTTVAALGIQGLSYVRSGQYLLAGLSAVLLVLALVMVGEVYQAFRKRTKG